jgi:hypothetical protein
MFFDPSLFASDRRQWFVGPVGEWLNAGSYGTRADFGAVVVARYQRARSNCMAPKTATKRVFLITDSDDPHADALTPHALLDPARSTLRVCSPPSLPLGLALSLTDICYHFISLNLLFVSRLDDTTGSDARTRSN